MNSYLFKPAGLLFCNLQLKAFLADTVGASIWARQSESRACVLNLFTVVHICVLNQLGPASLHIHTTSAVLLGKKS